MSHPSQQPTNASPGSIFDHSFVGLACIVAACTLAVYWFGWILLRISMWLIAAAVVGGGGYAGYLASRAKDTHHQKRMWILCGACVAIGALVWCLIPKNGTRSDATAAYWLELTKLSHEADAFGHSLEPTLAQNVEAGAQKLAQFFGDLADDIMQLSTGMVDPDAVDFAADTVQALRESKLVFGDMLNLWKQAGGLSDRGSSASMYFESFVRGAMGDPFGTYNEFKANVHQIGGQWEKVQARWTGLQQNLAALDARELKLRATLSDRYHREFPPLSAPKKRPK